MTNRNETMTTHDVIRDYGIINERTDSLGNHWIKRVRFISWNGQKPLLDVREWSADDSTCRAGMRLNWREVYALGDLIENIREEHNRCDEVERTAGNMAEA